MDPGEIPKHRVEKKIHSPELQILRSHTPELLNSLIEDGKLEDINSLRDIPSGSVTTLEGGISSACYFLENNGKPIVIKFRTWGINSEAESLKVWKTAGVEVPEVISVGNVSIPIGTERPVKYLILEGVTNTEGKPADTGEKFLSNHPNQLEELGTIMGHQLFLLHQAKSSAKFGSFGDDGKFPQVESWSQNITNIIQDQVDYLTSIGISNEQYQKLLQKIESTHFPEEGSYLHNDFGPKNILVESENPLKIKIFDPDPLIGDPYWDIAHTLLRLNFHQSMAVKNHADNNIPEGVKMEMRLVDSIVKEYIKQNGKELDRDRLLANLIGITIIKNTYAEKRQISEELEVRRKILKDYIDQFTA